MKKKLCILFLFPLLLFAVGSEAINYSSLDSLFKISGIISDSTNLLPLKNVSIQVSGTLSGATSDSSGFFELQIREKEAVLVFSLTGYEKKFVRINHKTGGVLNIFLVKKITILDEVVISPFPIEIVIKSRNSNVFDYDFYGDNLLLISFSNSLKRSALFILDRSLDTIGRLTIPAEPVRLYKDCMENNHVVCKDSIYQVHYDKRGLYLLSPKSLGDFEKILLPCIEKDSFNIYLEKKGDSHIVVTGEFHNYKSNSHSVIYSSVNIASHKKSTLAVIADEATLKQSTEEDRHEQEKAAAGMYAHSPQWADKLFAETILFKEIYAPLFNIKEKVYIFDYINSKMRIYSSSGKPEKEIPITFHRKNEWKRLMCKDAKSGRIFAVFESNGITELKEVNLTDGSIISSAKIPFVFIDDIKADNNYIYFLYKGKEDYETRYLSRLKL
ncbi:MAG: carboxypeptidase-like regulatory domain-containing protein [Bacteroidia bacterium]